MEHNEYAIWTVKIQCRREMREQVFQDESRHLGYTDALTETHTILAPRGDLGRALLKVHFAENTSWKHGSFKPFEDGSKVRVLEMTEQKLHGIIRYDDAYRGRM